MSTPIAELVALLLASGLAPDAIAQAVDLAQQHAESLRNSGGMSGGMSGGIPVDEIAERRRAYDRERKAEKRKSGGSPVESPRNSETALILKKEKKEEIRKERKKERARKLPLPPDFEPSLSHYEAAERDGQSSAYVLEKLEDMRLWALSSGALKVDWAATLHVFIRNAGKRGRGPPYAAETSNGFLAVHRELRERMDAQHRNDEPDEQAGGPDEGERRLF